MKQKHIKPLNRRQYKSVLGAEMLKTQNFNTYFIGFFVNLTRLTKIDATRFKVGFLLHLQTRLLQVFWFNIKLGPDLFFHQQCS